MKEITIKFKNEEWQRIEKCTDWFKENYSNKLGELDTIKIILESFYKTKIEE